ncbi:MAG: hypothetical protein HY903_24045 [Deltaproteobacteria bacterium]|nr:hypothetical protein [Deltaproteobacteria bacterium]
MPQAIAGVWWVLAAAAAAEPVSARLTLEGQRGVLDLSAASPQLRFELLAKSSLPVVVDEVEVGVLFAADEAALEKADPAGLYAGGGAGGQVGVVRQRVSTRLAPAGRAALAVLVPSAASTPEPKVFRTHVLGYHLADLSLPLLLELLQAPSAADERAAVEALALAAPAVDKLAVRERFSLQPQLRLDLLALVQQPVPMTPIDREVRARAFAIAALGVLGGDAVVPVLQRLLRAPELAREDDAFAALLIDRLSGSALERPLAYAMPVTARRMADLVAAALDDALGPKDGPQPQPSSAVEEAGPSIAAARPGGLEVVALPTSGGSRDPATLGGVGAVVLVCAALGTLVWRRARRKRQAAG